MPCTEYTADQCQQMLAWVRENIALRLNSEASSSSPFPSPSAESPRLQAWQRENKAAFVTLYLDSSLRGCIGSLEARRPLWDELAHNAAAAAFDDPRFPPLRQDEFDDVQLHISVICDFTPLGFLSEDQLKQQITPGLDGVLIEYQDKRATFLPHVWHQLPDTDDFFMHLKQKAGITLTNSSDTMRAYRYRVTEIGENGE